jgi:predicted metal-dependent phosphoesterase TrpH
MTIDLHCHTRISDNTMSIREVIALAASHGITHLAITDHDTTVGIEEAMKTGVRNGVEIIPGIEISAYDFKRGSRAHILGYYVEPGHDAIESLCRPLRERRHEAGREMVAKLIEAGYPVTQEGVERYAEGGTGIYKQHIMHALIEAGVCSEIYGPLYKSLFARGEGGTASGIAYVPLRYLDVRDAISAIKEAGGVPVLAHPGQFDNYDAVPEWLQIGLAGIEVRHPLHNAEHERLAGALAERYDLIQTGGSDYHGFYGQSDHLIGCRSTEPASLDRLKMKAEENKRRNKKNFTMP